MKLAAIARDKYIADGQEFGSGEVVAVIETTVPADCLVSSIRFQLLDIVPIADDVTLRHDTTPPPINKSLPIPPATDPDELNAQDAAEDAAAAQAAASDGDDKPSDKPDDTETVPAEFEGLTARVVGILAANGMATAADVKAWVESGKELTDLDGIGKAAAAKIKTIAGIA